MTYAHTMQDAFMRVNLQLLLFDTNKKELRDSMLKRESRPSYVTWSVLANRVLTSLDGSTGETANQKAQDITALTFLKTLDTSGEEAS